MKAVPLSALMLAAAVSSASRAQAPAPQPATPSEPHEKLAFFEGDWTVPALDKYNFRETCAWMAHGRRHMVCRSALEGPNGPRAGISIFSYDTVGEAYVYRGFRPNGNVVEQRGRATPSGFVMEGESGTGALRKRSRVTLTALPDGMRFVEETAEGDGPWKAAPEILYRRARR